MGKSQREKGVRSERLWRDVCRAQGFNAERGGQLYQRGSVIADVIGLPYLHQEVKAVERLNLRKALEQSAKDSKDEGQGNMPMVAHKMNRQPWVVSMYAQDWFRLYKGYLASIAEY